MALSKSSSKAQDITSCYLCELETKLKWKCIDCDLLMCNKCYEKIHPKFKNANNHTVVDIKDVGLSSGNRHIDFTSIICKVHTTQASCLFCSTCDNLVCPICIAKNHAGHTFMEIKEAYDMLLVKLNTLKIEMEKNEKGLVEDERKLNQLKISEISKGDKVLQDIEARKESFIKYSDQLLDIVRHELKVTVDSIFKAQTKATNSRHRIHQVFSKVDECINSTDPLKVFENMDNVQISSETTIQPYNIQNSSIPQFIPGIQKFTTAFGSLRGVASSDEIEMKVKRGFFTRLKHCIYLLFCSGGSLWLGDSEISVVQKIKPDGDNLSTISTWETTIRGIAVTVNGDVLIADATPRLKLISETSGKVTDSKYGVEPLNIMSVHVTNNNKIVVGAISNDRVSSSLTGRRVVIVIDQYGKQETMYEHDKNKQRLFSYPKSITSTINGNIIVADYSQASKNESRILALANDGTILNTYTGNPDVNNFNKTFRPNNIATTPLNNIIVPDINCNIIHILDSSCNLISYYKTSDLGIEHPYCAAFTTSSTKFYLGCSPAKGSSSNAKLYELEYSGF